MPRADIAGDEDHTHFSSAHCELKSSLVNSKEMCTGALHADYNSAVRGNREKCEKQLVFVFCFDKKCGERKTVVEKKSASRGCIMAWKIESEESTKTRCRELDTGLSFAGIVESSSNSFSPIGIRAVLSYISGKVTSAVMEMTSPTTGQQDVGAK